MALKESNKNRKKTVEPTVEVYEPVIQTDSTIGWVFIICLVLAFFAAM
jgi:hypothetical protein